MSNMKHYDNLKIVPVSALKPIDFGKLKGKSDINPQWRYEVMTQEFGMCGLGWKYEIVNTWTQPLDDGQLMVFVEILLYVRDFDGTTAWGEGIPAIGGDFLIEKDKNGIHGNDEAYKMATTDALGVAMKMLGVAADVYRGLANDSKYGRQPQPPQSPAKPVTPPANPVAHTPVTAQPMSDIQRKKLFATVKEKGMTAEDMKAVLAWKYQIDSSSKLTTVQASWLIDNLEKVWLDFVAAQNKEEKA